MDGLEQGSESKNSSSSSVEKSYESKDYDDEKNDVIIQFDIDHEIKGSREIK